MDISQMYSSLQNAKAAASASTVARAVGAGSPGRPASTARAAAAGITDSSTSTKNANITSNDFLVLLVTEMKHQDPTATTDPNAYINQLVGVNSLQQLIQINASLGGTSTGTTPTTGHASSSIANALSKGSASSLPEASGGNSWTPKAANASNWETSAAKSGAVFTPPSN